MGLLPSHVSDFCCHFRCAGPASAKAASFSPSVEKVLKECLWGLVVGVYIGNGLSSKGIQAQWLNFLCLFRAGVGKNGKKSSLSLVLVSYCKYYFQFLVLSQLCIWCPFSCTQWFVNVCFTSVAGLSEPFPPAIGAAAQPKASIYGQWGFVHSKFTRCLFFFLKWPKSDPCSAVRIPITRP